MVAETDVLGQELIATASHHVEVIDAQFGKAVESDVLYKGKNEAMVNGDMNTHEGELIDVAVTDLARDEAKYAGIATMFYYDGKVFTGGFTKYV